jgi:flagellar biogenesis protein FliO
VQVRRSAPKSLRLRDSLALGERRFVAVVECERERFLIGGASSSVVLLSRLAETRAMPHEEGRGEVRGEVRSEVRGGGHYEVHNEAHDEEDVQTPLNALWSGGAVRKPRSEPC